MGNGERQVVSQCLVGALLAITRKEARTRQDGTSKLDETEQVEREQ
jgi:hypothetical protein